MEIYFLKGIRAMETNTSNTNPEMEAKAKTEAEAKEKKRSTPEVKFADIGVDEIEDLSAKDLKRLCREESLSTDGKKEDMSARLIIQKGGITDRYAGQLTRCKVCRAPVRVTGTNNKPTASGTVVTRQIKCRGKHCHTYPLAEVARPKAGAL